MCIHCMRCSHCTYHYGGRSSCSSLSAAPLFGQLAYMSVPVCAHHTYLLVRGLVNLMQLHTANLVTNAALP